MREDEARAVAHRHGALYGEVSTFPDLREHSLRVIETSIRYMLFAVTKKDSLVLDEVHLMIDIGQVPVSVKQRLVTLLSASSDDLEDAAVAGRKGGFFQRKRAPIFGAIESLQASKVSACLAVSGNSCVTLVDPETGCTALMLAASLSSLEMVEVLLRACLASGGGSAVDAQSAAGDTALMMALRAPHGKENAECVRRLFQHSNLDAVNSARSNAIHVGSEKNPLLMQQLLSELPSLPAAAFAANASGDSPLFIAARNSSSVGLLQLLCSDPRVSERIQGGTLLYSAFHVAVHASNVAGLRVLADNPHLRPLVNVTNKEQYTPLYVALEVGSEEMQNILLGCGADPRVGRPHSLLSQIIRAKFVAAHLLWLKNSPHLTALSLSCCQLSVLPPALFALRGSLRSLDVSNNLLEVLPRQIVELTELRELILSNNSIRSGVNADLLSLVHLQVLRLDGNPKVNQSVGPLLLCRIRNDPSLNLSSVGLSELQPEFVDLCPHLQQISMNDNGLSSDAIGPLVPLAGLQSLWLHNNLLTVFPSSPHWTALELLKLSGNKIKVLPALLDPKLREVWVEHNQLTVFPVASIGVGLRRLWLDNNQISSIVPDANGGQLLQCLSLKNNQLHEIPSHFITSLTRLWLDGNLITQLPVAFSQLVNLVCLSLSENPLREFPVPIASLKQLAELSLNDCLIESIDPRIGQLALLRKLSLRNNRIVFLPQTIGLMTGLVTLDVTGNFTLMSPPSATVRNGTQVGRAYSL